MANNKKIIWIGIASALLIGGGIFWWVSSKKKAEEEEKRKQEEEAKRLEEEAKSHSTSVTKYPTTPFTNKTDGDKFRTWVNKKYPDYAKQNDISLSGDYNNSFIRKAYAQYGTEYTTSGSKTTTTTLVGGFNSGSLVYLKSDESSIYSFPDFKGDYIIGSVNKTLTLDRPFAKYISNTGKGFLKVETIAFNRRCPPNAKCRPLFQAIKKIAYVPETSVSNKPY